MAETASATLDRPAEESVPQLDEAALRLASVPRVALGLPAEAPPAAETEAAAPTNASEGTGQTEPPAAQAQAAEADASTQVDATATAPSEQGAPPDGYLSRDEHEREMSRRITEYQQKRDAQAIAEAQAKAQADFERQQAEYERQQEELLERALNGDEQARLEFEQNKAVKVLRAQVEKERLPALEQAAQVSVLSHLAAKYREGYAKLAEIYGQDLLADIHDERFNDPGEWVVALGTKTAERAVTQAVADARAKWEKEELAPAREAAAAQARAEVRGQLPSLDASEGVSGGMNANGVFQTKADFDRAMAAIDPYDPDYKVKVDRLRSVARQRGWERRRR